MSVGYVISYNLLNSGGVSNTGYISGTFNSVTSSNFQVLLDEAIASIPNPELNMMQVSSINFLYF